MMQSLKVLRHQFRIARESSKENLLGLSFEQEQVTTLSFLNG
jgi:hypothetical protein